MIGSTLVAAQSRRTAAALAALLASLALAAAVPATATAAKAPRAGRWEGTTKDGGRVAFAVGWIGGKRVVAGPSTTCPRREDAFHHQPPEFNVFSQDWENGNGFARRHRTARLQRDGSFALALGFDRRALAGRLGRTSGRVSVSAAESPGGCRYRGVKVRRVGKAFGDAIYVTLGSFLTRGRFAAYSGGGLVVQESGTIWGGPPEPRITQQLGPAAGLLACTAAYGLGAMATDGGGGWGVDAPFRTPTNTVGKLKVTAGFVTATKIAGDFRGDLTTLDQTRCTLNGAFAGTRVLAPAGPQLRARP